MQSRLAKSSIAISNEVGLTHAPLNVESLSQTTSNRSELITQRKIKRLSESSAKTKQLKQIQDKADQNSQFPIQKGSNNTGLPDNLKSGIEHLSGIPMDDVKVHFNSERPAQLQAHAYAQGNNIHLTPGQEKHLPHEAWHVVQQKQGRVKGIKQFKSGVFLNDDTGLEQEADVMGKKANNLTQLKKINDLGNINSTSNKVESIIQRIELKLPNEGEEWIVDSKLQPGHIKTWIDHQAEELNSIALGEFIGQMTQEKNMTPNEVLLYRYAFNKRSEVIKIINLKLPLLEAAANPESINNIPGFLHAQAEYQNQLANTYSKSKIMQDHQSVGLEFEFATYSSKDSLESHLILAESKPFSNLFPLSFVLETDSGYELEIGFPPLLIPINQMTKKHISNIWTTMRRKMAEIRENCGNQSIEDLKNEIQNNGIGYGWKMNGDQHKKMRVSSIRGKHLETTDNVYSQLNISMDATESAKHLREFAKDPTNSTPAEIKLIHPIYDAVQNILAKELSKDEIVDVSNNIFTHLSKAVTNIMAIPSIHIVSNPIFNSLFIKDYVFDLHSTVKELHGIWIKDSLPNILRTIGSKNLVPAAQLLEKTKGALLNYIKLEMQQNIAEVVNADTKKSAKKYSDLELINVIQSLDNSNILANEWFENVNWESHNLLIKSFKIVNSNFDQLFINDKLGLFIELEGCQLKVNELKNIFDLFEEETGQEKNEAITYLGPDDDWSKVNNTIEELKAIIEHLQSFNISTDVVINIFCREITNEINGTINLLKNSKKFISSPKSKFNKEQFGTGHGVRKDTHIPTLQTEDGQGKNVAEIRGDSLINKYVNS